MGFEYFPKALQKFYRRSGRVLLFRNGESLNQLASDMSVVLEERFHKRGFNPSHLSRVINGERLFTPEQLTVFCELQKATAAEQQELTYVLADERLRALGLSMDIIEVGPYTIERTLPGGKKLRMIFLAPRYLAHELVGRDALLRDLKQHLFAGHSRALTALNGVPGVGKTALAVALAHDPEVLEHFQDGVLWAGIGRDGDELTHLSTWAAALGISSSEFAKLSSIQERSTAILTAIGSRHMLLVADDVWKPDIVKTFRLTGPNCAYIVTTRKPEVASAVVSEPTTVEELNEDDGLQLLSRLAPRAVEADPNAARTLVRAVGSLPLSIVLMGHYLREVAPAGQPRRLREAFDKLKRMEERLRLAERQTPGDEHTSVRGDISLDAMIGGSYEKLGKESQYVLRALSVFPSKPNTFSEDAALAVSGKESPALDKLYAYGLLEVERPGRYVLHQTISDYAKVKRTDESAYERMVKFFVHFVETHETDYGALDLETSNVLAALEEAFSRGMYPALVRGANAFYYPFLATRGLSRLGQVHLLRAQDAARSLNDTPGLAIVLLNLGRMALTHGDHSQAEQYLQEALGIARSIPDPKTTVAVLSNLGILAAQRGKYAQAEAYWQDGLDLAREMTDLTKTSALLSDLGTLASKRGEYIRAENFLHEGLDLAYKAGDEDRVANILMNLGVLANKRGDYARAEERLQQALTLARKIKHRQGICFVLENLGAVLIRREDYTRAEGYLREGLDLARELENPERTSMLLADTGMLMAARGNHPQAHKHLQDGLALARQIEHRWDISTIQNECGELYLQQGELDSAFNAFKESLNLARQMNASELIAIALYGLARVAAGQGNMDEARTQAQESLSILQAMRHGMLAEITQWLIALQ